MSMNARRHNRKAKRPDWMERTSSPNPERPTYRLVDWPLGEGEDDGGEYPRVFTFTDRDEAIRQAHTLLTEYAESRASVAISANGHGYRPDLREYTTAAIELGKFEQDGDWYWKRWELDTDSESVTLTIIKT